ncbi:MAG TPA: winged helix-turn-helix domain-containing protein [Micromonosporaceae bacterium]|nr:winged helix-turn-helix domain-containing protein [Micromonosporaceae bacterium]
MTLDADDLDDLAPDDPRPPSLQIANVLRAAILTRRIAPGERLPSQNDLTERYGVARETVKAALRILRDERLVVTRQGSGAFVRSQTERPVGLRPHIEAAFERTHVSVDFAGFSGETLHGALSEPLDKIRAGRLTPESIAIRILLPDLSQPTVVPSRTDTAEDDPAVRDRAERISRRHTEAIAESVQELAELGLVRSASADVRRHGTAALFKIYILNNEDAFFGFYPVVKHTVTIARNPVPIYDVLGKDVPLFQFATSDEDDMANQYVQQARAWFDSVWTTIAREYQP